MSKLKFYSGDRIRKTNADYMMIYGERSNGKTYDTLLFCMIDYYNTGRACAYVRRWEEDIKGTSLYQSFSNLVANGEIEKLTKGKYNDFLAQNRQLFLCKYDENNKVAEIDNKPCCFAFAISQEEHYKSKGYDSIYNVVFDEFLTRNYYLPEEFIKFQNLLSTIIRHKTTAKIYMLGNTINKYCPYFAEMGLKNIKTQKKGTIDLYTYGDSDLLVAVEFADFDSEKKKSNKYFAFNNPKLNMITGQNGVWEIGLYPHLPVKFVPKNVISIYYIVFNDEVLQANIININENLFTFIHAKTTPIKDDNFNLVYDTQPNYKYNYRLKITKPSNNYEKFILSQFVNGKIFYSTNDVGEIVRNYLQWCKESNV